MKKRLRITNETLDASLPPMSTAYEGRANRLLDQLTSKQEEPIVKRKMLGVVLIAALVLMLAVGAVALVLSNYERVAEVEAQQGAFDRWPAQERVELVEMLLEEGLLERDARVEKLLAGGLAEAEAEALATEIVTEGLGLREDVVTFTSLLEKAKGPMGHWSAEDKAWYTEVLRKNGMLGQDADTAPQPVMPDENGATEEQAIRIAFDAVKDAHQLSAEALATYKVGTEYYAMPGKEDEPKWMISFFAPNEEGGFRQYANYYAVVDPQTGAVVSDPEAMLMTPAEQVAQLTITPEAARERQRLYDTLGAPYHWTAEDRARYHPEVYGFPAADEIPEEEAIRIARQALEAHPRFVSDRFDPYAAVAMYMIANPMVEEPEYAADTPYWNIQFVHEEGDPPNDINYGTISLDVHAKTGEVTNVWGWGDAFPPE